MKWNLLLLALGASMLFCFGTVRADTPELEASVNIQSGSQNLSPGVYSAPTCVDWNNDGAKDLVVGTINGGSVWLYLNTGTDLNPTFNGSTRLKSGGVDISVSYG